MKNAPLVAVGLVLAALCGSAVDADEAPRRGEVRGKSRVVPADRKLPGTVTYDTGVNVGFYPDDPSAALNRAVGNRFNSALGGPLLMTGMVTALTIFPATTGPQSVSIALPPNSMGSAMVLGFVNAPVSASQFNSVEFPVPITVGSDFLAFFIGTFGTHHAAGLLGMSDMDNEGQGFHALQAFYFAGMASMIEGVPGRNAMLRATGDILVPVELMNFEVQ